ncbi:unnamed protein product [Symbiodinium microadriaticum]|nr:unnamed protein product [Symbiodinium microadriaticum]
MHLGPGDDSVPGDNGVDHDFPQAGGSDGPEDSDASADDEISAANFDLSSLQLEMPGPLPQVNQESDAERFAARLLKRGRATTAEFETLCGLLPADPESRATAGELTSKTFMSGLYQQGGIIGLRAHVASHPWTTALLCSILRAACPGPTFTSVVISRNRQVLPHRDSQNGFNTWNILVPASRFSGGGVWQECEDGADPMEYEGTVHWGKILPVASGPQLLDPRRLHATLSWKGIRTVVIGLAEATQTDEALGAGHQPPLQLLERAAGEEGDTFHGHLVQVHSFVDGCGLSSPGRWRPTARGRGITGERESFVKSLRKLLDDFIRSEIGDVQRAFFMLAPGKYEEAPFSDQGMSRLRRASWFGLLEDPSSASHLEPGQPFYLEALSQTCRAMGDEDWEVLTRAEDNYSRGRRLGVNRPFPRVVAVFRPKGKWREYDESEFQAINENYASAKAVPDQLEKQFEEEEALGFMYPPLREGGESKNHDIWVVLLYWLMVGTPFKWSKFRGGVCLDYVGFYFDYFRFKAGLSERRAKWIMDFILDVQNGRGMIEHRRFTEFVGRLVYAGQVLYWLRPFMGPLHRWKAAIHPGTVALMPRMVMVVLRYLLPLAFRTDAKAEDDFFVLGGDCKGDEHSGRAPGYVAGAAPVWMACNYGSWLSARWKDITFLLICGHEVVALFDSTLWPWSSLWTENKFEEVAFLASCFAVAVEEDALVC